MSDRASAPNESTIPVRDGYYWEPQICPICRVAPTKFIGRRGGAAHRAGLGVECEVWRCGKCDLVFPNPMPVPVNGVAQHYELDSGEYFQHHDPQGKAEGAHLMLRRAEQLTKGKGRILDIGAGRGELLRAALDEGWSPVGIEPSASFAEHAERLSGIEIRQEPVEQCGFADASFDVVILAAVLEHLYNPVESIAEIARILRPGGALFLDVPNERGLYFRAGNLYERLRGRDWTVNLAPTFEPFHVFGFNSYALRTLLANHGFVVSDWKVYAGRAVLPERKGIVGYVEKHASELITALSRWGEMGTYIETWALKQR